jgi:hypothetical protein
MLAFPSGLTNRSQQVIFVSDLTGSKPWKKQRLGVHNLYHGFEAKFSASLCPTSQIIVKGFSSQHIISAR